MLATRVRPQRHVGRQLGADQDQGTAARTSSSARSTWSRASRSSSRRTELGVTPSGGFGETVAPPTPDFAKTLGGQAENVLGSSQWTRDGQGSGQVLRHRDSSTARTSQAKYDHATRLPRRRGDARPAWRSSSPPRRPARPTPDKVRDALAGLDTESFFGRIKFDDDRPERLQADVGDPDPGRQGRHRVADGGRGGEVRLARRQAVSRVRPGNALRPAPGRAAGAGRRRLLPGVGRHERRQPGPRRVRHPRRLRRAGS